MAKTRYARHLRVGLQSKSVLILALLVVTVTASGGWLYLAVASQVLRDADRRDALRASQAIGVAAWADMRDGKASSLNWLAKDLLEKEQIRYVALLDRRGRVLASASRDIDPQAWSGLAEIPISVSWTEQRTPNLLTLASPVVVPKDAPEAGQLVGAARLVLDTGRTTAQLAEVQRRMTLIAVVVVVSCIPLGYVLVWRVILQPVRNLAAVTRRLAGGDLAARAELNRNDEIGELGTAFDGMAGEISRSHAELRRANAQLERKVAERTAELQKANQRLREEMTEKEDFLRAVSHDLSAPLRNIGGMATMAMMKWRDSLPEDVIARLQRIQANVEMETSLISDLLELSRIKTRRQKPERVDVGELVEQVRGAFEYELKDRDIEWVVGDAMPTLYVEKNRLRAVLQNLVDNAIKYMHRPHGGRIEIGYRRGEGMHEFTVRDNGPGIRAENHEKIFYMFRRSEGAAKVQGKGVGLALVKSIASTYDGRAWVESQPGAGATFHVCLDERCTQPATKEEHCDAELAHTP